MDASFDPLRSADWPGAHGDLPEPAHVVQFYEDDRYLLNAVTGFVGRALEQGAAGLIIATARHREALEQRWERAGLDLRGAREDGRYMVIDAESMLSRLMDRGKPNARAFEQAFADTTGVLNVRYGQLRVFGEMVALLWEAGHGSSALALEEMWNDLTRPYGFSTLCGYPLVAADAPESSAMLDRICLEHSGVIPAESYTRLTDPVERQRAIARLQHESVLLQHEVKYRQSVERALSRRERELADFLEHAIVGMHQVNAEGIILWANRAELEMLGYAAHEYVGHHVSEFHAESAAADELMRKLLAAEPVCDHPAQLVCKDGRIKHVLIHANALFEDGRFVHSRCFVRDVTEQVRLEQQLQKRMEELAEQDRRKDEFLALLGHELRNPLSPMVAALEHLRVQGTDAKTSGRALEIMDRQVKRMTRLVNDLLDVSRVTDGKLQLQRELVTLRSLVDGAIELQRSQIAERRQHLEVNLPQESVWLHVDAARLEQVLSNLLHNASKFSPPGSTICLDAAKDGAHVQVAVRDNGIGIDREMQKQLFDVFVQGPNAAGSPGSGLGIGLTLVCAIVELHGGKVSVRSEGVGRGAEFLVRLPVSAAPENTTTRRQPAPAAVTPRRFLVVDDNIDAADTLAAVLRASGHHVDVAYNGARALEIAQTAKPDVIVLDIGLPGMDGHEVARRLRAQPDMHAKLIAVTGYGRVMYRDRSQAVGFDEHLVKPVTVRELQAAVRKVCAEDRT